MRRVAAYSNYGDSGAVGHAMCRGNPNNAASMPGGIAAETFQVPRGVTSIDTAVVQIDPDGTVTATATLVVDGLLERPHKRQLMEIPPSASLRSQCMWETVLS